MLHERLGRVLERDDPKVLRLASARTSVSFTTPRERVTLLLDRRPPALANDGDQAERFAAGALNLPLALLGGEVARLLIGHSVRTERRNMLYDVRLDQ